MGYSALLVPWEVLTRPRPLPGSRPRPAPQDRHAPPGPPVAAGGSGAQTPPPAGDAHRPAGPRAAHGAPAAGPGHPPRSSVAPLASTSSHAPCCGPPPGHGTPSTPRPTAHPETGPDGRWEIPKHAGNGDPPRRGRVAAPAAGPPRLGHATLCGSDAETRPWPTTRAPGSMHTTHGGVACGAAPSPDGAWGRWWMRGAPGAMTARGPATLGGRLPQRATGRLRRPHSGQVPSVPDGHPHHNAI